jgi:Restriction endonuclease
MSGISRRQVRPEPRKPQERPGAEGDAVPAIPRWVADWGFIFLVPAALAVLWAVGRIGHVHGAGAGWALFVIAVCGAAAVWWLDYSRRLEAAQARREQALYVLHEITKVDVMTWQEFEENCAELLRGRGYRDVVRVGSTPDDHGADIIATAPDGARVAVRGKRSKNSVGPDVIRSLIGAINSRHRGRTGMVMTNALATSGALEEAKDHKIAVVYRPVLQEWMSQARSKIEQNGHTPQAPAQSKPPAAKVATGVLCFALFLLAIVAFAQAPTHTSSAATPPRTRAAVSVPSAVVRDFFTAISRHNWQKVWQLAGRNLGYGPYASYSGMISGYRLTERDVVTTLKTGGDTVSGRFLAYETTGAVQAYEFSYAVHDGAPMIKHIRPHAAPCRRRSPPAALTLLAYLP